jgi:hypothetical protein
MISRRAMLGTGAVVGGTGIAGFAAQSFGVLDDGLRAAGLRPHRTPDPNDVDVITHASLRQGEIVGLLDDVERRHGVDGVTQLRAVLVEQWRAVAKAPMPVDLPENEVSDDRETAIGQLADVMETVAASYADGALSAGSLDVVKVLAAMSAGLEQVAVAVRRTA